MPDDNETREVEIPPAGDPFAAVEPVPQGEVEEDTANRCSERTK